MTPETSLEEVVEERQFAGLLQTHSELFFRLANTLLSSKGGWNKKHYFQLINESDALETFLDDYGAKHNQTYCFLRELVASIRAFALSGYSLAHLERRLASYGTENWLAKDYEEALEALQRMTAFHEGTVVRLLEEIRGEATGLGVELTPGAFDESNFAPVVARLRLPRNLGQAELVNEEQKIAEVASKYIRACERLSSAGIRTFDDPDEMASFFASRCTEDRARTIEAAIHNLQSTYDTHVQNTVLEAQDDRLPLLRAHVSASRHLIESVTHLIHFVERHEDEERSGEMGSRLSRLVPIEDVQRIVVNELLVWVHRHMQSGYAIAKDLLPAYTNVQELKVELAEGLNLHARPAALVVKIVNHHGTPVTMRVGDKSCNAASILELLVTVGSNPEMRELVFQGDERPLRDIRLLVEHDLGENGTEQLPSELRYLRA